MFFHSSLVGIHMIHFYYHSSQNLLFCNHMIFRIIVHISMVHNLEVKVNQNKFLIILKSDITRSLCQHISIAKLILTAMFLENFEIIHSDVRSITVTPRSYYFYLEKHFFHISLCFASIDSTCFFNDVTFELYEKHCYFEEVYDSNIMLDT